MSNELHSIELKDVKTQADFNKFLAQECITTGFQVSLFSYVFGIIAIPLALRKFHKRIPLGIEYKLAIGACSMLSISYFAGNYVRDKCEKNVRSQLLKQLVPE